MRKHRIAFVVPDLQIGGAERQVVDLVNHLDRDRFDVTLFTFEEADDLAGALAPSGLRRFRVPRRFKLDTRPIAALARVIREHEVELVHCTLQMSLLIGTAAIARSGRRVRLVDAIHTTRNRGPKEELADRLLYRWLMARCDRVITVCEAQLRHWASRYPALAPRMVTVYNGIDLDAYKDDLAPERRAELKRTLGIEPGDFVAGMMAAIRPEKNHLGVLEAAARVARWRPRLKLLFVGGAAPGSEELEQRVRRRAVELGLERNVRWLGNLADPKPYVSLFDVALLFSTTESFPLALLECLAMGRPVVAARLGGVPEIVEHGRNGVLVPAGDVDGLATALARLDADPRQLRALSSRARPSVEPRFSVERMARDTEAVLMSVIAGQAPVRPAAAGPGA